MPAAPSSSPRRRLSSIFCASIFERVPVLSRMRWPWKMKSRVHTLLPLYRYSDMSLLGYESGVLGFPCLLMPDLVGGRRPDLRILVLRFLSFLPALCQYSLWRCRREHA